MFVSDSFSDSESDGICILFLPRWKFRKFVSLLSDDFSICPLSSDSRISISSSLRDNSFSFSLQLVPKQSSLILTIFFSSISHHLFLDMFWWIKKGYLWKQYKTEFHNNIIDTQNALSFWMYRLRIIETSKMSPCYDCNSHIEFCFFFWYLSLFGIRIFQHKYVKHKQWCPLQIWDIRFEISPLHCLCLFLTFTFLKNSFIMFIFITAVMLSSAKQIY